MVQHTPPANTAVIAGAALLLQSLTAEKTLHNHNMRTNTTLLLHDKHNAAAA
jgi:hypothetical protein